MPNDSRDSTLQDPHPSSSHYRCLRARPCWWRLYQPALSGGKQDERGNSGSEGGGAKGGCPEHPRCAFCLESFSLSSFHGAFLRLRSPRESCLGVLSWPLHLEEPWTLATPYHIHDPGVFFLKSTNLSNIIVLSGMFHFWQQISCLACWLQYLQHQELFLGTEKNGSQTGYSLESPVKF